MAMARSRWGFTASIIPGGTTRRRWVRVSSFTSGRTSTGPGRSRASSATTTTCSGSETGRARQEALRGLEPPGLLKKPREHVLADLLQTEQHRRPRPVVVRQIERRGIELQQHLAIGEVDLDGDAFPVFLQAGEKPLLNVQGRRAVG